MIVNIDKYSILIDDEVIEQISTLRQGYSDNEIGGVILGNATNDNRIMVRSLKIATDPMASTKYSCIRDKNIAQVQIDKAFKESEGKVIYLGEWHTHPEHTSKPSKQDMRMIKEQYKHNEFDLGFLLLLIIGTKQNYISIYSNRSNQSKTFSV